MRKNRAVKDRARSLSLLASIMLTSACSETISVAPPDFSGLYRPAGLEIQPCGANEWMRRNFDTDEFCLGSLDGWSFSEQGLGNWRTYSPIEDPVLRCRETFPRTAMRGRPMRITYGAETIEIAYWFGGKWTPRTLYMNEAPPAGAEPSDLGRSVGRFVGDTLIVETTGFVAGPMFNDHKPVSAEARTTERYWRAPDGRNLLMDIALDDPVNYTKPFLLNRQEWIAAPDAVLDPSECTPSSIWAEDEDTEGN